MAQESLGQRLWDAIESAQGYSFIASDIVRENDATVAGVIRSVLPEARKVVRVMNQLLAEHDKRALVVGGE